MASLTAAVTVECNCCLPDGWWEGNALGDQRKCSLPCYPMLIVVAQVRPSLVGVVPWFEFRAVNPQKGPDESRMRVAEGRIVECLDEADKSFALGMVKVFVSCGGGSPFCRERKVFDCFSLCGRRRLFSSVSWGSDLSRGPNVSLGRLVFKIL